MQQVITETVDGIRYLRYKDGDWVGQGPSSPPPPRPERRVKQPAARRHGKRFAAGQFVAWSPGQPLLDGEAIRDLREYCRLTQRQVALAVGCARGTVAEVERYMVGRTDAREKILKYLVPLGRIRAEHPGKG